MNVGILDTSFDIDGIAVYPNSASDQAKAIALDANGKIYVTGNNNESGGSVDMVICKYQ